MLGGKTVALLLLLLLAIVAVTASTTSEQTEDDSDLQVRLASKKQRFTAEQEVVVTVRAFSKRNSRQRFSRWALPLRQPERNTFLVTINGRRVEYLGRLVKRVDRGEQDTVELTGRGRRVRVTLSQYYNFSETGEYNVTYVDGEVESNSIVFFAEGRAPSSLESSSVSSSGSLEASSVAFGSCTGTQQNQINAAAAQALTYAQLGTTSSAQYTSTAFRTWFGNSGSSSNQARSATVQRHYSKMVSVLQKQTVTFDCTCKDRTVFAYVYPGQTAAKRVYLCGAFWAAPNAGRDSRGGTIVHELSHFVDVGGTNDWVYGVTSCKRLAKQRPSRAANNADSHEYFVEIGAGSG